MKKFKNYIFFLLSGIFCFTSAIVRTQDIATVQTKNIWQINDSAFLFTEDTIKELWIKDKSLDIWKLNTLTDILTFNNSELRIWRNGNKLSFWTFDKTLNDWNSLSDLELDKQSVNDSISYTQLNDSLKWIEIKGKIQIYKTYNHILVWNKNKASEWNLINDTISFYKINDTTQLWLNKDSSILWNMNLSPKIWKISNSTIVWTIDELNEFWKAGKNYNLWYRASDKGQWEKNLKVPGKRLDSLINYWAVNQNVIIFSSPDSVQIWRPKPKEIIWNIGDSIKLWRFKPPKIIEKEADTVVVEAKLVKKAELLEVGKSVKIWTVNDTMKLYASAQQLELWRMNKSVKLWKITDSTLIWNISQDTKVSMISDTLSVWKKNEPEFDWKEDSLRKPKQINPQLLLLQINDSTRFTKINDTTSIWNSFGSVRLASKSNVLQLYVLNDTTEFWEANDSTKLWIDKYAESGQVWEKNKRVNILNINDSTKIWQLNENVRLSIINNKLRIWRQGIDDPNFSWKESLEFKHENISDTIKLWHIDENTIIWETRKKIEVWNLNEKHEIYRLNDTCLVYTYSTAQVPPKLPNPSYWTYLGTGKMDMAQVWVDQWAKGGENSISTLFIVNLQANYAKKKIKWDNDFEYRYGFIKPGDRQLRKNEDKIKLNSIFNYYAFKKFYYGFTVTGLTQFFKGYHYVSDTVRNVVSDFMAPLYFTAALGLNYFPVKQLSVFFSPLTYKTTYVRDTLVVDQTSYGIPLEDKIKQEPGLIVKSILNWNISKNINVLSKLDLFTRYNDLKKYNVDWETTLTFKFTNFVQATLNTHLIYDPDVLIKQSDETEISPVQFKEVLSIGLFYKI